MGRPLTDVSRTTSQCSAKRPFSRRTISTTIQFAGRPRPVKRPCSISRFPFEWYRDLLEEKLQDCLEDAVPAPDLDEQVANDPAVKAAKQAYDEAYAKAYAEARKRL